MTERTGSVQSLLRAFREAGFSPKQINSICSGDKKAELREFRARLFPPLATEHDPASHVLVQKIEEVFTYGALEDIDKDEGFGAVHSRLMIKFADNKIDYVGDLVALSEREARRILGEPSSKTYRAAKAVLATYGLYISMELPDRV